LTVYPPILSMVPPVSGYLSDRIRSELLTLIGLFLTAAGLFLLSTLNGQLSYTTMVLFIAVMSVVDGMFQSPNNSLIMSTPAGDKQGIGGSVNALVTCR
jgi:sugar phosphate permease